jgi:hypothetical protein
MTDRRTRSRALREQTALTAFDRPHSAQLPSGEEAAYVFNGGLSYAGASPRVCRTMSKPASPTAEPSARWSTPSPPPVTATTRSSPSGRWRRTHGPG